jgi:hypothetical protein
VKATVAVVLLGASLSSPALAQQREKDQALADQKQAAQKTELRTFELVLRTAVERGGQQFAVWAKRVAPEVMLAPVGPAMISSVPIPERATVFEIQIPEIIGTSYLVPRVSQMPRPQANAQTPTQPIAGNAGKAGISANNVIKADPMTANPSDPCEGMSPDQCYSELVRLALIDAIIDSSSVLTTLKDDETLTVAAMGIDVANTNPFYANTSRKLLLHIKGADLTLYRQGKISRDDAKNRILEIHF